MLLAVFHTVFCFPTAGIVFSFHLFIFGRHPVHSSNFSSLYFSLDFYVGFINNSRATFFSGTVAFLRSISLEAVGLGVHLAAGAHDILLQAEYILTSIPPSVSWPVQDNAKANIRCNQPKDAQQGIHKVNVSICLGSSIDHKSCACTT